MGVSRMYRGSGRGGFAMALQRITPRLLLLLLAVALLIPAGSAHAASLHIADAEVTVKQGGSSDFTIALTAGGALTCDSAATVSVASAYSVGSDGSVGTNASSDVTFSGGDGRGNSHNCDVNWDGAPERYLLPARATAEPD